LLANPGFEQGDVGWGNTLGGSVHLYSVSDYPQFIHSGAKAALIGAYQTVHNVTPGVTYRLGAWGRAWSSPYEDRAVSQEPGDVGMFVCINTMGDTNHQLETSICSGRGKPLDTWQYFAVDAVAATDQISALLISVIPRSPRHNETFWDDVFLGVAPTHATPSPVPQETPPPARPAPVPFDGVALRDSMVQLQWVLDQMGGLLDRLYNSERGTCEEYAGYYRQVVETSTYDGIPAEWQSVYDTYVWADDNAVATNEALDAMCQADGGSISYLNYTVARTGIVDSLARLIPAIGAANQLLGQ
jgi:hypothetical protein